MARAFRPPALVRWARSVRWAWRTLTEPMVASGFGGEWKGASTSRLYVDWIASLMSADQEMRGSLRRTRARGRELARNTPEGSRFLDMFVANVVGDEGFDLRPRNRDARGQLRDELNNRIRDRWYQWAEGKVTLDRELGLVDYLQMQCRTWCQDGEIFARRWVDTDDRGLALEAIDPDQVDDTFSRARAKRENEVRLGVEVDRYSRRLYYHVLTNDAAYGGQGDHERVPASDIIHTFIRRRANQTRGITMFAPVMWVMRQLSGYIESELVAARVAAAKMFFLTQNEDAANFDANAAMGTTAVDPNTGLPITPLAGGGDSGPALRMTAEPGVGEALGKGVDVKFWDPQHPTTAFGDFTKRIKRDIASGLSLSYNAHANDGEAISFSTARDFANRERDDWRVIQKFIARQHLQQIFAWWLEDEVMSGRLDLGSYRWEQFLSNAWMPRGWRWVDPPKDIEYAERAIALGLGSRTRFAAELGIDFEETLEEIERETAMAAKKNISIVGLGPKPAAPNASAGQVEAALEETGVTKNGNGNGRIHPAMFGGH